MRWRRYWMPIVSIIVLVATVRIVQACYFGDDPYDSPNSFFSNTLAGGPAYVPFYYISEYRYYDEGYGFDELKLEKLGDQNIPEWQSYCNNEAKAEDIDSFIYKYSGESVQAIYDYVDKKKGATVPPYLGKNSFAKWLAYHKDKRALAYIVFAKKCEPFTYATDSYWDDSAVAYKLKLRDTADMQSLTDEGKQLRRKAKSKFLQWRYNYQVLRMAFYSYRYNETLQLFDELAGNKSTNSIMYARCLGLKAGALYRLGRKVEAAYTYSLAFDLSDEMKKPAHISFNWAVDRSLDSILALCKSGHEKAVVNVMYGLYEFYGDDMAGADALEDAYKADPTVAGLDVVMVREINKAEQLYLAEDFSNIISFAAFPLSGPPPGSDIDAIREQLNKYLPYLDRLRIFAQKAADEGKNGHVAFWHLASSYLALAGGKMAASNAQLDIADKLPMSESEKEMAGIIHTLYIPLSSERISAQTEAELLPALKRMEQSEPATYSKIMTKVLAEAYLKQGDSMKAIFCLSRAAREESDALREYGGDYSEDRAGSLVNAMDIEHLKAFQAYRQQANKSEFERWLSNNNEFTVDVLRELEATKYIRFHQFDKAVATFKKLPGLMQHDVILPNPFIMHIDDYQIIRPIDTTVVMNKMEFAEKMLDLQLKLLKNPKDADAAYLYAAGLYNISYYGRACYACTYHRGIYEPGYIDSKLRASLPAEYREYYDPVEAEKYFLVAIANSKDPEQKAKCTFMAAKCKQKRCGSPQREEDYYSPAGEEYYSYSLENPYFVVLKNKYAKTKFYKIAYNTCSYFKDYVNSR